MGYQQQLHLYGSSLESLKQQHQTLLGDMRQLEQHNQQLSRHVAGLQAQLDKTKSELAATSSDLQAARMLTQQLQNATNEATSKIVQLEKQVSESRGKEQRSAAAANQLAKDLVLLNDRIHTLTADNASLQDQLASLHRLKQREKLDAP
eukprot:TRINITY_DN15267_c0_g2_i2.p1 TRINITY_DN15267_c0_g2~~TRINITY_DN15267_c0_g2_i2.p1  ORF type:complete len:149 (+),score=26.43 TRINITY_DN15267_c0_g2_i2:118-564(+)